MWVLEERTLKAFWTLFPQAMGPLVAWLKEVERARWRNTADIRARYRTADFVGDKVIFNIGGNKYRLVAGVDFAHARVFIKAVLTHGEYDKEKWK